MKISKKLAKEIFNGDFSNVNFDEIKTNGRERVIDYHEAKRLYKRPEYILVKDFDSLEKMELVHTPDEDYARAKRGVHLQTDVLVLKKYEGDWYVRVFREDSKDYKKKINYKFTNEKRTEILERLAEKSTVSF